MMTVFYPVVVDRDGDEFVVRLPDFGRYSRIPWTYDPFIEAQEQLERLVERRRRGRATPLMPPPSSLAKFAARDPTPALLFQVPVGTYREYVRVGINMEPTLLRRIDEAATIQGMSRTAFLSAAARTVLRPSAEAA